MDTQYLQKFADKDCAAIDNLLRALTSLGDVEPSLFLHLSATSQGGENEDSGVAVHDPEGFRLCNSSCIQDSLGSWLLMAGKTRLRKERGTRATHSVSEVPRAGWQSVFGMRIRVINTLRRHRNSRVRREAWSLQWRPGRLVLRPFKNGVCPGCSPL